MFENLRRDAARYAALGGWRSHPGFWAGAIYRFGTWGHSLPSVFLRVPVLVVYRILRLPVRYLFNIDLWAGPRGARIGPGLCLIHPSDIMIGRGVEIGEDCLIFHGVTVGTGANPGRPKVGDNVDIYPGACVLGGVSIGNKAMIGANCVVTKDVPAESVVVAQPNRIIPRTLSRVARSG